MGPLKSFIIVVCLCCPHPYDGKAFGSYFLELHQLVQVSHILCGLASPSGSSVYCGDVMCYRHCVCASCVSSCGWWAGKLTFSAGGLVESTGPGPPLLADLGPRLLCRPLDGGLISLLEVHKATTEAAVTFIYLCFAFMWRRKKTKM